MVAGYVIRPPAADELGRLVEIEAAAGRAFADHGMPEIAADDPGTMAELEERRAAGLAWVAAGGDGPLAYLLAAEVDGCLHIEHCTVVNSNMHRTALTLTTFRDIPWNAPYYARLGFAELPEAEWGPQLRELVARERRAIPGDHPRVAMIRPVGCLAPVMHPPPAG